jgi:uncharacterized membrane protein
MRQKNVDLIVAILFSALNIIWALLSHPVLVIGVVLGLPLVFILPGYVLTEVLWSKRSSDAARTLLLSLGLSVSISIVTGLVLNLFPSGLQATTWAVSLGFFTTVFSLLAFFLRRGGLPVSAAKHPNVSHHQRTLLFNIYQYVLIVAAVMVIALTFVYSVESATQQPHAGFTQFWILPGDQSSTSCSVRLGVRSFEKTPVTYRITVSVNNIQLPAFPSLNLSPQKEWNLIVPVTPGAAGTAHIQAQLYRMVDPHQVYRQVNLLLPQKSGSGKETECGLSHSQTTVYPSLVSAYTGTVHILANNKTIKTSLGNLKENKGDISGYFNVGVGLNGSGLIKGSFDAAQYYIHYTVYDTANHALLSFQGIVQLNHNISGTFCSLDASGTCDSTASYGSWSMAPTT